MLALYLLLLPQSHAQLQHAREPRGDHPVYASTSCPTRLWQPNEIPVVYEINLAMSPTDFSWLVTNQALQCERAPSVQCVCNALCYHDSVAASCTRAI